jgi:hypothetical protein
LTQLGNSIGGKGVDEQGLTLDITRLAKRLALKLENDVADPRLAMIEEIREFCFCRRAVMACPGSCS